jgi:hypothetical protein
LRRKATMANRNGLEILGGILAGVTVAVALAAFAVVRSHVGESFASDASRHTSIASHARIAVQ